MLEDFELTKNRVSKRKLAVQIEIMAMKRKLVAISLLLLHKES
jgi:hypothetical protein